MGEIFPFIFKYEISKQNILRSMFPSYEPFLPFSSPRYISKIHSMLIYFKKTFFVLPELLQLYLGFSVACTQIFIDLYFGF
jgi:hypothetical protein